MKFLRWTTLACAVALGGACDVPEGPPTIGDELPDLAYPLMRTAPGETLEGAALIGDTVRFSGYEGEVVLVNLWATWCGPCRYETPYLQELYAENRERGFSIVGVSTDTPNAIDAVADFTSEMGVEYDILLDNQSESTGVFGAFGLPATMLVDRGGVIRWMMMGPLVEGDEEFLGALESLLDEGESTP